MLTAIKLNHDNADLLRPYGTVSDQAVIQGWFMVVHETEEGITPVVTIPPKFFKMDFMPTAVMQENVLTPVVHRPGGKVHRLA